MAGTLYIPYKDATSEQNMGENIKDYQGTAKVCTIHWVHSSFYTENTWTVQRSSRCESVLYQAQCTRCTRLSCSKCTRYTRCTRLPCSRVPGTPELPGYPVQEYQVQQVYSRQDTGHRGLSGAHKGFAARKAASGGYTTM